MHRPGEDLTAAEDTSVDARAQVRAHIEFKASVRELQAPVAQRMLAALDAGADPDYAALLEAATFLPLPARCYHTAPASARASIARHGLRPAVPADGSNWGTKASGQAAGVYVGAEPDVRGVLAHEEQWDVWQIDTSRLAASAWQHDRLNPGSWVLLSPVTPELLTLHTSHDRATDHG